MPYRFRDLAHAEVVVGLRFEVGGQNRVGAGATQQPVLEGRWPGRECCRPAVELGTARHTKVAIHRRAQQGVRESACPTLGGVELHQQSQVLRLLEGR